MRSRVVVVGAGLFGLAAARALLRRGHGVVIVDPGPVPHPLAASTDVSKAVRMDYGTDHFWIELAERAMRGWRVLEHELGAQLFHEDGFVLLTSRPMAPGEFEHDSFRSLEGRGVAVERLDERSIHERFGAFTRGAYVDGYFNPRAGWVESGRAIELLGHDLRRAGAELRLGEACVELVVEGARATTARLSGGEVVGGDALVLAAGAWTARLVPGLAAWLRPIAQPVLHLRSPQAGFAGPAGRCVWAADIARAGWYGFPAQPDGRLKVGHHGRGSERDPALARDLPAAVEERFRRFLRASLPGLADAPSAGGRLCFYCDTPDGDFWVDRDEHWPGLVVAAGGSGHAFKFLPVIGEVVADVVEGRESAETRRFAGRRPEPGRHEAARSLDGVD